jgi:hypothetical protein
MTRSSSSVDNGSDPVVIMKFSLLRIANPVTVTHRSGRQLPNDTVRI